jgi:putative endonuclease
MDITTTHRIPLDRTAIAAANGTATLGAAGERLAAQHLVRDHGLTIVARNWRLAAGELRGELDLVAIDEAAGLLVVGEVKTRRDAARFGGAIESLGPRQRRRLRALTGAYLRETGARYAQVRLDLLAIDVGREASLTHLEGVL